MIYLFSEVREKHRSGGKGKSLVRLYDKGFRVPDGLIITSEAFKDDKLLDESILLLSNKIKVLSSQKKILFAVRSSAEGEDSSAHSFAGEFESLLNVGEDNLISAIEKVYASRNNERVDAYAINRQINSAGDMAVVVQLMIQPLYAGVIFSADPVTGRFEKMVGNAVKGLGEDLVSGEKDSIDFTIQRDKGTYSGPKILKKAAKQLFETLHAIEKLFTLPMDVEWAWDGKKIYILQARPITTLSCCDPRTGGRNDSLCGAMLWSNANVAEAVPDVMTPATWSVLKVFHEAGPVPFVKIVPGAANIAGRPYMNVSYMISIFAALGKDYKDSGRDEFFGHFPENLEIPLYPQRKKDILPLIIKASFTTIPAYKKFQKDIPAYVENNPAFIADLKEKIGAASDNTELCGLWDKEIYPCFLQSCKYLRVATLLFGDKLSNFRKKLNNIVDSELTNNIISDLSGSSSSLASLNLVKGVYRIQKGELTRREYIEQWGFRGPHEFELSIPDMQENPDLLDDFLASPIAKDPMEMLSEQKKRAYLAWEQLKKQKPRLFGKLKKEFGSISYMADRRERVRAEMIRMMRSIRLFYLKAGELSDMGDDVFFLSFDELLSSLEDSHWETKTIEERKNAHKIYSAIPYYPPLVKGAFDPEKWWNDPDRRMDIADSFEEPLGEEIPELKGHAASCGIAEGVARVIIDPEKGKELKEGEILVAATTNVGWTPYFLHAAGVITDVGAPLSHAAIVARELGIPAVVGCGHATTALKTGDLIRMNGGDGSIVILKGEEN